jgi:hypothetical protein
VTIQGLDLESGSLTGEPKRLFAPNRSERIGRLIVGAKVGSYLPIWFGREAGLLLLIMLLISSKVTSDTKLPIYRILEPLLCPTPHAPLTSQT